MLENTLTINYCKQIPILIFSRSNIHILESYYLSSTDKAHVRVSNPQKFIYVKPQNR